MDARIKYARAAYDLARLVVATRLEADPRKPDAGDYWLPVDRKKPWRVLWPK